MGGATLPDLFSSRSRSESPAVCTARSQTRAALSSLTLSMPGPRLLAALCGVLLCAPGAFAGSGECSRRPPRSRPSSPLGSSVRRPASTSTVDKLGRRVAAAGPAGQRGDSPGCALAGGRAVLRLSCGLSRCFCPREVGSLAGERG